MSWNFIGGTIGGTTQATHADQHAAIADPFNANVVYVANDGGLYSYNLGSRIWRALNFNVSAGQIQSIRPHPSDNNKAITGFQDNGTQIYGGSQGWQVVETGDGGFALFDSTDPAFAYHTFASVGNPAVPVISTSTDGGKTWHVLGPTTAIQALIGASGGGPTAFYPSLAGDPSVAHRVMLGGHAVFVSTDGMFSRQLQTAQDLTGGCANNACALQDIEIAPGDRTRAWSLSTQTGSTSPVTPFKLYNTTQADLNTGAAWSDVTANLGFSAGATQATGIALNRNNPDDAYLSVSGFTGATGVGHIFRTTDFGATWVRSDGAGGASPLPDVPVLRVLVDSADLTGDTILAATDIGVFRSTDSGRTWAAFNLGMIPAVAAFDIEQNYNDVIFAGTHGRGGYRLSIKPEFTPGTFNSTGNMSTARFFHTVTALPDGKALVVGGVVDNFHALSSAELYDSATHAFTTAGNLLPTTDDKTATRSFHSATLLLDGRVLIAGGQDTNFNALQSAELYSPGIGFSLAKGSMVAARVDGKATLLCDGRVLISGGSDKNGFITNTAELYDPKTGTFTATGSMHETRDSHTSTLLHDCREMVAGGANGTVLNHVELYDPAAGTFTLAAHTMVSARVDHAASLMADGRVLITGGKDGANKVLGSAELYDPRTGLFTATGDMSSPRLLHTSNALINGQVLIAGGSSDNFASTKLASAELYDPATGKFSSTNSMNIRRVEQVAAKLITQQVLVVGGIDPSGSFGNSAELYQPPLLASPMVVPTSTPTVKPSATAKATTTPSKTPTPTLTHTPTQTPTPTPSPTASPTLAPGHPFVSSIPPTILAGSSFVIDGINFTAGSEVNLFVATSGGAINGGPLIPITPTLPTQLTVKVPATTPLGNGFVEVQVVNTDTGFLTSNLVAALLQGSPAAGIPSITSINTVALADTSSDPSYATNNVETVVVQGKKVTLGRDGIRHSQWSGGGSLLRLHRGQGGSVFLQPRERIQQYVDKLHAAPQRAQSDDRAGFVRGK